MFICKERVSVERLCEVGCMRYETVGNNIVELAKSKEGVCKMGPVAVKEEETRLIISTMASILVEKAKPVKS
jgi:hypothetical protein